MKQVLGLVALVLLLASCEQPTVDPDQKLRDTIVGLAWLSDPVAGAADVVTPKMVFEVGGSVIIDSHRGTWSYVNAVFAITGPLGTYQTTSPSFDTSHFVFFYGPDTTTPQLIHLIR